MTSLKERAIEYMIEVVRRSSAGYEMTEAQLRDRARQDIEEMTNLELLALLGRILDEDD